MLDKEEGFLASRSTLANVSVTFFFALLQPVLPSGAAGFLGLELAFPLGLFHLAKGVLGRAEPVGVLIRARVSFCYL